MTNPDPGSTPGNRIPVSLAALTALALAVALYSFAGYAMSGSFSVAEPDGGHAETAVRWGLAALGCLVLAIVFAVAAWRRISTKTISHGVGGAHRETS